MNKFMELLKNWGTEGVRLPLAFTGQPVGSSRLLFAHISFWLALWTVAADKPQVWTAIAFFGLCSILSMFNKLQKASFDLDDKELELESEEGTHEEK